MTKMNFSQRRVDDAVPESPMPRVQQMSEKCSSKDESDDNSSHDSSTWSSSTHLHISTSSLSSSEESREKYINRSKVCATPLPPPILVYHESARSIVFRDNMHRACDAAAEEIASVLVGSGPNHQSLSDEKNDRDGKKRASFPFEHLRTSSLEETQKRNSECLISPPSKELNAIEANNGNQRSLSESLVLDGIVRRNSSYSVDIKGFQPQIVPLPRLELGRNDEFQPLILSDESQKEQYWTPIEKEVYQMMIDQQAAVKTIKNTDWTQFLHRFKFPRNPLNGEEYRNKQDDIGPHCFQNIENEKFCDNISSCDFPYNSFVTSTTLLPSGGIKMRAYGTTSNYTTGVVFAIPKFKNEKLEEEAAKTTNTWSWPSGYSAKTEFNIDRRGELINGRAEALVPLSKLRMMNDEYVSKDEYVIGSRVVKGGLKTVPYNELFLRVGGRGRTHSNGTLLSNRDRSFENGAGLPIAIFCRTASFGHLFSLLRTRARMLHTFGEEQMKGLPLLMISPDLSIRILTEKLQHKLLKVAAQHLNPFQNSLIAHKTKINNTDPDHMQTKLEELIELDDEMRKTLTEEELVRIAGGFGATDDSVAKILRDAMVQDKYTNTKRTHKLQDIVNEGLAASVRASDYYTSRQLLILYSLVSSESHNIDAQERTLVEEGKLDDSNNHSNDQRKLLMESKAMLLKYNTDGDPKILSNVKKSLIPRPPPPPLDTDRLRSATNSDGLLAVLGAAQILKAMQDGGAKRRTKESWEAVEEWIEHGEKNIAFRLASWRDQRAAQDDLEIAVDQDSSFMAFVSGKAISNRKKFALQLHRAVEQTDFNDMRFLLAIDEITNRMHSPCLRLELLQYVLGLDNRYSIAHVKRAVELAATCLNISSKSEQ